MSRANGDTPTKVGIGDSLRRLEREASKIHVFAATTVKLCTVVNLYESQLLCNFRATEVTDDVATSCVTKLVSTTL